MSSQAPFSVAIRYKLAFRNDLSRIYSLNIPIERLDGGSQDIKALRMFFKQDKNEDLLLALLGDIASNLRQ